MTFLLIFAAIAAIVPAASATLGVDVSTLVSTGSFTCLKNSGYSFAIVRAWRSNGQLDGNAVQNVNNANAAGMGVSMYMFPCYSCGDPA